MFRSRSPSRRARSCRRTSWTAVLVSSLALALAGCGSDSPSGPGDDGDEEAAGEVSVLIAGVQWSAAVVTTTFFNDRISFVADDDEWRLVVQVRGFTGPATYGLSSSDPVVFIHLIRRDGTGVWGGVSSLGTGQVTITSATPTRATGTFSGVLPQSAGSHTAIDTVRVENGTFDVPR